MFLEELHSRVEELVKKCKDDRRGLKKIKVWVERDGQIATLCYVGFDKDGDLVVSDDAEKYGCADDNTRG